MIIKCNFKIYFVKRVRFTIKFSSTHGSVIFAYFLFTLVSFGCLFLQMHMVTQVGKFTNALLISSLWKSDKFPSFSVTRNQEHYSYITSNGSVHSGHILALFLLLFWKWSDAAISRRWIQSIPIELVYFPIGDAKNCATFTSFQPEESVHRRRWNSMHAKSFQKGFYINSNEITMERKSNIVFLFLDSQHYLLLLYITKEFRQLLNETYLF